MMEVAGALFLTSLAFGIMTLVVGGAALVGLEVWREWRR